MSQRRKYEHGPSWWAAENIRMWRKEAGYSSAEALAEKLVELGVPMNRSVLSNIENHRREALTIEELCAFALALNVSPSDLVVPHEEIQGDRLFDPVSTTRVAVTPTTGADALFVRQWFRGSPLPHESLTEDEVERFRRKAPSLERKENRAARHPLMVRITALQTFVRDALTGPSDMITPKVMAMGLRDQAARVTEYTDLLARETEEREDWGDLVTDPALRASVAQQIKKEG